MQPELLIGIPLYNKTNTVIKAVGSALAQIDVSHRVLVSDNGSQDDGAAAIETAFPGVPNLQVVRHQTNSGATWNFNWLLAQSSNPYFMWLASDDWLSPDFAARCIERLKMTPEASLAFGRVNMLRFPEEEPFLTYSAQRQFEGLVSQRMSLVYRSFPDVYMYGVMRTQMAQSTGGLPSVPAADIAFVRRLALVGPFVNVPEAALHYCTGSQWKSMDRIIVDEGTNRSLGTVKLWRGKRSLSLMIDALDAIKKHPLTPIETLRMLSDVVLAESERILKRLVIDGLGVLAPKRRRAGLAMRIHKRWLAKEEPQIHNTAVYLERVVMPSLRWCQEQG